MVFGVKTWSLAILLLVIQSTTMTATPHLLAQRFLSGSAQGASLLATRMGRSFAPISTITAYCLNTSTTSGPTPRKIREVHGKPCIALSRKLARDLGLKKGKGQFDYRFGAVIEVIGVGRFHFADLMPTKWTGYRVDVWQESARKCHIFGVKRCRVRVVK